MTQFELTTMLYQALESPLGLVFSVSDPGRFKQAFYAARRAEAARGRHDLAQLSARTSPGDPTHEVWVVRAPAPTPEA